MRLLCSITFFTIALANIAQDLTQFISYEVPIHEKVSANYKNEIIELTPEIPADELIDFKMRRLADSARRQLFSTIFEKLKSGQVLATYADLYQYSDAVSNETPEKYFQQRIPLNNIDSILSYSIFEPKTDPKTGVPIYDNFGSPEYTEIFKNYETEDIVSLTFYEEWTINGKTNILSKEVKGYTINVIYYRYGVDFAGVIPLCYIPCKKFKMKGESLAKNIKSHVLIKHEALVDDEIVEVINEHWWVNHLNPIFRNQFLGQHKYAPFASPNYPVKLYDYWSEVNIQEDFPYTGLLTMDKAEENSSVLYDVPAEDPNTGLQLYDQNGDPMYDSIRIRYQESDIQSLDFIEEWYFDDKTLSIQKKIKGIMPAPIVQYDEDENSINIDPIFWIRYKD